MLEDVEVGTYNCRHQTSKTKQELESSWKVGNATHLLIAPACTEKPQNWGSLAAYPRNHLLPSRLAAPLTTANRLIILDPVSQTPQRLYCLPGSRCT